MKSIIIIFTSVIFFTLLACEDKWETHFNDYPETVNENVWEIMKNDSNISHFVSVLTDNGLDTLFASDIPYTVFAPSNEAMKDIDLSAIDTTIIKYHIVSHFIQSESANGKRQVKTLSSKFLLFENQIGVVTLDGIAVTFESPLYKNGKYFIIDELAQPNPSLYEYFARNNTVLREYIDSKDSIVLNLGLSKPIGFNDEGNTVFDSVTTVYNIFEQEYFPVRQEFRNKTATIVFPLKEDYENALTQMAVNLGGSFVDYRDIPSIWQQEILVPYLLSKGVFENMLEPEDFVQYTPSEKKLMKNILGDSVRVTYMPTDKVLCSNGYAYNYSDFQVPDSLYNEATRFETETFLIETGINRYAWIETVKVSSTTPMQPFREYISTASNDSIVRVLFPSNYTGTYSVEFETHYLFPRKYVMAVSTHMDVGGIYDIYVNDELIKTFDYYDFVLYRTIMPSVVSGQRYIPVGRFNKFDMYLDNINEFSRAKIRFEYRGPGRVATNGLVLDYIEFIPVKNE